MGCVAGAVCSKKGLLRGRVEDGMAGSLMGAGGVAALFGASGALNVFIKVLGLPLRIREARDNRLCSAS